MSTQSSYTPNGLHVATEVTERTENKHVFPISVTSVRAVANVPFSPVGSIECSSAKRIRWDIDSGAACAFRYAFGSTALRRYQVPSNLVSSNVVSIGRSPDLVSLPRSSV